MEHFDVLFLGEHCAVTKGCKFYVWIDKTFSNQDIYKRCHLKSTYTKTVVNTGVVSGTPIRKYH